MLPQPTNLMVLAKLKSMHLVLNMLIFTRTLVTYARTTFKPHCCLQCLNVQSMRTQAESTDIAHNMFGQIKMRILWYNSRQTLISRKRDGKPRMVNGQFVVVRVGSTNSASLQTPLILCFESAVNSCIPRWE